MSASNTSKATEDMAATLFRPGSLAVILAAATPANQFRSGLAKSQEKVFFAEVKGSRQKLIRDGPYFRNVERQLFDSFIKKYQGHGISASRRREMRLIFGRATLPENYKDVFADKLARFNASKELQEAAAETFWQQMEPNDTALPSVDNTGHSSPNKLMRNPEGGQENDEIITSSTKKRKRSNTVDEVSDAAAKIPDSASISESQDKEKDGLPPIEKRQSSSKQGADPLHPDRIIKVLTVLPLSKKKLRLRAEARERSLRILFLRQWGLDSKITRLNLLSRRYRYLGVKKLIRQRAAIAKVRQSHGRA